MLSPQHTVLQAKLTIVYKKLDERTAYVKKHCVLNRSMRCKQKWAEIKALHKAAKKLEDALENEEDALD